MIGRLVLASATHRPLHTLLLLAGYAVGVGVTIVLLSIGAALVEQSRDTQLVGGGDLAVLPAGLDTETMRTGGTSSMFYSIDQASMLYRDVLAGTRFQDQIAAAAPWIDGELLYLESDSGLVAVTATATISSLARQLGVTLDLIEGQWTEVDDERRWQNPTDAELYRSIDAMHIPTGNAANDSTWAEWHYFNVLIPGSGWLYLTYMVGGRFSDGSWSGRMLATRVEPGAPDRVFESIWSAGRVSFAAGHPDLRIGPSAVTVTPEGAYRLIAEVPATRGGDALTVDLTLASSTRRYLPPVDVGGDAVLSGYVVPLLDARARGRVCEGHRCTELNGSRAYHDHNWGTWSGVTWDWGHARIEGYSVLYGGVSLTRAGGTGETEPAPDAPGGPRFLYLADEHGFAGVLPVRRIDTSWPGTGPGHAPDSIVVVATDGADSLTLRVTVRHARNTRVPIAQGDALFFQMRGGATLAGRLQGASLEEWGDGFFETWCVDCATEGRSP